MDALELMDLARLGLVSSGLRDVLQAPIPHQALEHCRAASELKGGFAGKGLKHFSHANVRPEPHAVRVA